MRSFETRMSPPRSYEECVKVTCDLCGDLAPRPDEVGGHYGVGAWSQGSYAVDQVVIRYDTGDHFPHSGKMLDRVEADICPTCFKERVRPALEALGVHFSEFHVSD